jgi:hypothetical protein
MKGAACTIEKTPFFSALFAQNKGVEWTFFGAFVKSDKKSKKIQKRC